MTVMRRIKLAQSRCKCQIQLEGSVGTASLMAPQLLRGSVSLATLIWNASTRRFALQDPSSDLFHTDQLLLDSQSCSNQANGEGDSQLQKGDSRRSFLKAASSCTLTCLRLKETCRNVRKSTLLSQIPSSKQFVTNRHKVSGLF